MSVTAVNAREYFQSLAGDRLDGRDVDRLISEAEVDLSSSFGSDPGDWYFEGNERLEAWVVLNEE